MPNNVKSGGEIVSRQCIEVLREKNDVHVVAYKRAGESVDLNRDDYIVEERVIETGSSYVWPLYWMVVSFFKGRAYSSQKYISSKYINLVNQLINNNNFDMIVIDHSQLSWLIDYLPESIPVIFISHNIEYLVYLELAEQSTHFLKRKIYSRESKLMKSEEKKLLSRSSQVWTLSKSDQQSYSKLIPNNNIFRVINVPGGFKELIHCDSAFDIGILGTWTWASNKKGLEWFLKDVLTMVDSKFNVALAGKGSLSYSGLFDNVHTLGMVDSAQTFLSSCRLIVIPTTAGGGIQIKTLDSISTNKPVVTTSIGIRGIDLVPDSVFVIDEADNFAAKINELLISDEEFSTGFLWVHQRRENFSNNLAANVNEIASMH